MQAAAHSIIISGSEDLADQCSFMRVKIAGVTGSLTLGGEDTRSGCVRWIPICTNRRRGSEEKALGSGRPNNLHGANC